MTLEEKEEEKAHKKTKRGKGRWWCKNIAKKKNKRQRKRMMGRDEGGKEGEYWRKKDKGGV